MEAPSVNAEQPLSKIDPPFDNAEKPLLNGNELFLQIPLAIRQMFG
jgi:hypothetical protein